MSSNSSDHLTWSATQLASAIREGSLTSRAAVEAHFKHLDRVNPRLNAVVFERREAALAEADEADSQRATALQENRLVELPPLLGVPCTIKENFELTGTPQASGLVARRGVINDGDAPTVARLRAAGAIPMGVTNTSELCMWMESFNKVYGLTRNPYDDRCTVGGSSGGEGAVVGSGASPFGLGADVGGSIRMPAFFNGVFGHKPSPLLIPNDGQFPAAHGDSERMLGTGPICRRATDLDPLVRILAGDQSHRLGDPRGVDFRKLRVLTIYPDRRPRPDIDQRDARSRAVRQLCERGARHQPIDLPELARAFDLWSSMLSEASDGMSISEIMFGSKSPARGLKELGRWLSGRSPHTLPLIILATVERLSEFAPRRHQKLLQEGRALRDRLHDVLGSDGVLIHPPYPTVAPRHYKPLMPPFNFVGCAIFNTMEVPATSVPMGLNADGLPTGVQIVAAPEHDHLGIACALALEESSGGWVPPWERRPLAK